MENVNGKIVADSPQLFAKNLRFDEKFVKIRQLIFCRQFICLLGKIFESAKKENP